MRHRTRRMPACRERSLRSSLASTARAKTGPRSPPLRLHEAASPPLSATRAASRARRPASSRCAAIRCCSSRDAGGALALDRLAQQHDGRFVRRIALHCLARFDDRCIERLRLHHRAHRLCSSSNLFGTRRRLLGAGAPQRRSADRARAGPAPPWALRRETPAVPRGLRRDGPG